MTVESVGNRRTYTGRRLFVAAPVSRTGDYARAAASTGMPSAARAAIRVGDRAIDVDAAAGVLEDAHHETVLVASSAE